MTEEKPYNNLATKSQKMTTYSQFGFRSAGQSNSNPDAISGYLDSVYDKFLNEQKLDEQGLKDRISQLKSEVQLNKLKKNDIASEIASEYKLKQFKEKEIEDLEIEKIDVRNGEGENEDTISFIIGAFITVLLTLYLFVFYSSSGYSAFYGVKAGSLGFINGNVFSDAINKGSGVIALILLFPVVFLGLGFLIHDSLEKNKKLLKDNRPRQFMFIICLLLITLLADAFIGYKISEGVHYNEFNAGKTEDLWIFSMIYSDINFYLVLILGFVVYVIWGFLLHYVLSHSYLKTESEKVKLLLENINKKILEKQNELSEIISRISKYENDKISLEGHIEALEKDIIGFENGVVPINISTLKGYVGEFFGGWQSFTNGNFYSTAATKLIEDAKKFQDEWITNKIESLNKRN